MARRREHERAHLRIGPNNGGKYSAAYSVDSLANIITNNTLRHTEIIAVNTTYKTSTWTHQVNISKQIDRSSAASI